MEVKLAVLADYSNISREGKLNILGIFSAIRSRNFPAVHPTMQLVMRLEAPYSELNTEKNLQVKLLDADGRALFEVGSRFMFTSGSPGEPLKSDQILTLNNLQFGRPGDYVFCILIGGEEKARVPLKLTQIS